MMCVQFIYCIQSDSPGVVPIMIWFKSCLSGLLNVYPCTVFSDACKFCYSVIVLCVCIDTCDDDVLR